MKDALEILEERARRNPELQAAYVEEQRKFYLMNNMTYKEKFKIAKKAHDAMDKAMADVLDNLEIQVYGSWDGGITIDDEFFTEEDLRDKL